MNRQLPDWRRRFLAALTTLAVAVLCLMPVAPAFADGEQATLEVLEVGWDGHVAQGFWSPIRVRVTGGAADLDGLLEVWLENQYQTGPQTTIRTPLASFGQEVSIPAHQAKELQVWVPAGYGFVGSVRLTVAGNTLASENVEFRPTKAPYWPLVAVLSDQEELAAQVGRIEIPLQGLPTPINVAQLDPVSIPTQADYMKGVKGLVVQGNLPSHLSEAQRAALAEWVNAGGHLVLAGGPDSALTAAILPAQSLPIVFGGADPSADLTPLLQWAGLSAAEGGGKGPIVRMAPEGGQILAGTKEQPLVWRNTVGRGMITVLAVDPTLEPLASRANGLTPLWKLALGPTVSDQYANDEYRYQMENESYAANRLRQAIEAMPPAAFPDWKELALWLGGFALLAGPLVHLAFWNPSRRRWVWLAVPLASVLVAGTIFASGVTLGGRDMIGHSVSHLRIDTHEGTAQQAMMLGIYAPMYPDLTVNLVGNAPINGAGVMDGPRWGPYGPEQVTEPPFRLIAGRTTRAEYNGGESAMRPVMVNRQLGSEVGQIDTKLSVDGDQLKGTVTNKTPFKLEDVTLLVARTAQKIGDLAPGESAEVTVTLQTEPTQNRYGYQSVGLLMLGEPMKERPGMQFPPDQPRPLELPRDPEIQRRARLVESSMQVLMNKMGYESFTFPLTVVAFTEDAVGPEIADLGRHPIHHLSLIEQRVELDLPAGPFRLPPALIPGDVTPVGVQGWGGGSDGKMSWMEFDTGSMMYTYTLPLPATAEVSSLSVTTKQMGKAVPVNERGKMGGPFGPDADPAEDGIFQIYNWQRGEWEWLPGGSTEVKLANAAPYVNTDLQVKVQVYAGSGRVIRFIVPQVTVEGRVGQ